MNNINLEDNKSCSCGTDCCGGHHHEGHDHECCGGHHHEGHDHDCCCNSHKIEINIEGLTEDESSFLNYLVSYTYLPVAKFVLKSTKEDDFKVDSLAPVYLDYKDDSMENVRFVAGILNSLEEKGIISIDYDVKLKNYDYSEYYESDLYNYFVKTVEESKNQKDFLGDIADIETGSIALTDEYMDLISQS